MHKNLPTKEFCIMGLFHLYGREERLQPHTQVQDWMKEVIPRLAATEFVEKVFFDRGTCDVNKDGMCNISLTDAQGNGTDLLGICSNFVPLRETRWR